LIQQDIVQNLYRGGNPRGRGHPRTCGAPTGMRLLNIETWEVE
jgi:hypothetical protein